MIENVKISWKCILGGKTQNCTILEYFFNFLIYNDMHFKTQLYIDISLKYSKLLAKNVNLSSICIFEVKKNKKSAIFENNFSISI